MRVLARAGLGLAAATLVAACAPALREPPPVTQMGGGAGAAAPRPSPADVDRLLADGQACFAKRPDRAEVRSAQRSYLEAARADDTRVEGLLGVARVSSWMIEHEPDAAERDRLVAVAIEASQWCQRQAPGNAACEYALAQALGQQARERPSTSHDGLERMVKALQRAAAAEPGLDHGGPERVLALVYLRAPGWPLGPGDPEAGLAAAQKAVALAPDHPPNQLALAEALARSGRRDEARAAYEHALVLARSRVAAGDPDAPEWVAEAERGLHSPRPAPAPAPGDAMTLTFESQIKKLQKVHVTTHLDDSTKPVTLEVDMQWLPDGTNYPGVEVLGLPSSNLAIPIQNPAPQQNL
jgi:tetratricopeptide (TPR) repeat protein